MPSAASASAAICRLAAMAAFTRFGFLDPCGGEGFSGIRQARRCREVRAAISARARVDVDPGDNRRRIVAHRRIDRRDAHELLRMRFELSQERGVGRRRVGCPQQSRGRTRKFMSERGRTRDAGGGEGLERRRRSLGGAERFHRREFVLIRQRLARPFRAALRPRWSSARHGRPPRMSAAPPARRAYSRAASSAAIRFVSASRSPRSTAFRVAFFARVGCS